ncbi:hypothetical protein PDE_06144 [Penicillium oxalicum 114-2]|uniref:J domain-containing protein n=2 Tax=Penicillium oxalicum TaxID=69781 RepID=S7ZLI4_PENO1|nr:hypothetical protein PDE_06144 [Penicillium oxalicum 114-2]
MPPLRTTSLRAPSIPTARLGPRATHSNRHQNHIRCQSTSTRPSRSADSFRQFPSSSFSSYYYYCIYARYPPPQIQTQRHSFSTSARSPRDQNYYEILDLPVTASPVEIKKKFYALSLRHHPDRNRDDPNASQRFAKISSAYSVLSNTHKRATYDRDHGFHHAHGHAHAHGRAHPSGSHSSHSANVHKGGGGYAGSRPASGLSNRRGTFRGPPPSFYAQGGYGATGRTTEGYAAGKAGTGYGSAASTAGAGADASAAGKKYDPEEDPLGFIERNPLHHFNARGHFRTQKAEDERRRQRVTRARMAAREKADMSSEAGGDFGLVRFIVVCGILVLAGAMTGFWQWSAGGEDSKTGKKRKDVLSVSS